MSEKTIYYQDLNGLIIVCRERQEFDAYHDIVWVYEALAKGTARIGVNVNYILARDIHKNKKRKDLKELAAMINYVVLNAKNRCRYFLSKIDEDKDKLERLFNKIEKGELESGISAINGH